MDRLICRNCRKFIPSENDSQMDDQIAEITTRVFRMLANGASDELTDLALKFADVDTWGYRGCEKELFGNFSGTVDNAKCLYEKFFVAKT